MMQHFQTIHFPHLTLVGANYGQVVSWERAVPVRPHWRIWWNLEEGAEIRFKDTAYPLVPDRLLLVPPHVRVRHSLRNPVRSLALHVELGEPMEPSLDQVFYPKLAEGMIDRLNQVEACAHEGFTLARTGDYGHGLNLLLGEIICRAFQLLPAEVWDVSVNDSRIESCIESLEAGGGATCSNAELADRAGLSVNAFIRLFSEHMGVPPQVYLQNLRLDRAARLLQQSDKTIEMIAEMCGFCDRNYLSKVFKRRFGVGPAHYRRYMS